MADAVTVERRDHNLDVLRAIAALGVLATHSRLLVGVIDTSFVGSTIWSGMRMTVYLFFAVSGFLIGRPFLVALLEGSPPPRLGAYAARRVARIVPAYWVALTELLVLGLAGPGGPLTIVDHYLLFHSEIPGDPGSLYPIAWTLGVEATFYLLLPIAVVRVTRNHRGPLTHRSVAASLLVLGAASAGLNVATLTRVLPTGWEAVVQYALPAQFMFFVPGMLLAVGEHYQRTVRSRPMPRLGPAPLCATVILLIGAWFGCMALFVEATAIPAGISSLGFALVSGLTVAAARCRAPCRSLIARGFTKLGVVSYGLYLWHWIVVRVLFRYFGASGGPFRHGLIGWLCAVGFVLALSIPLATLSWFLVERPSLRFVARRFATRATPPVLHPA